MAETLGQGSTGGTMWLRGYHICLTPKGLELMISASALYLWSLHMLSVLRGFPMGSLVSSSSPETGLA